MPRIAFLATGLLFLLVGQCRRRIERTRSACGHVARRSSNKYEGSGESSDEARVQGTHSVEPSLERTNGSQGAHDAEDDSEADGRQAAAHDQGPTFLVAPAVLAATSLFATYLPARRAASVAPIAALRQE